MRLTKSDHTRANPQLALSIYRKIPTTNKNQYYVNKNRDNKLTGQQGKYRQ